jgi:hypothetical protein
MDRDFKLIFELKFVKMEGKGAKQELMNKMLEMILKENNLL